MIWYNKEGKPMDNDDSYCLLERMLGDISYKRVDETILKDGKRVSTVWLGLDHNYGSKGPPLIFETMVFPPDGAYMELDMDRYSTLEEAQAGHNEMVKKWSTPSVKKCPACGLPTATCICVIVE